MISRDYPLGQGVGQYQWTEEHIPVIRYGIERGLTFIDTAPTYDNGNAEYIVGKAIEGIRDRVVLCTKFSPEHSSFLDVQASVEKSLSVMNTSYIDVLFLHWPNPSVPIEQTVAAMLKLVCDGKVKQLGVCNIASAAELQMWRRYLGMHLRYVQVEYSLFDRTPETFLDRSVIWVAYSPLDRGRIIVGAERRKALQKVANKVNKPIASVALSWLRQYRGNVIPIPKVTKYAHIIEAADDVWLSPVNMKAIEEISRRPVLHIPVRNIQVALDGQDSRKVYLTEQEAIENPLGFVPSPLALSQALPDSGEIKPVRLVPRGDSYALVEGRIRYWAWVLRFGKDSSIPALIREEW